MQIQELEKNKIEDNKRYTTATFINGRDKFLLISKIVETIKSILKEDSKQENPLFLKVNDSLIYNIAKKIIVEKERSLIVGIAGESASGKTTFVQSSIKSSMMRSNPQICTVVCCDDYYKDTSKELEEAGSYEALYATGFSFDTPKVFNLDIMKEHLMMLKQGMKVYTPKYDFVTCNSVSKGELKEPAYVIINEGLYVLTDEVKDIMDVKVYVFTPIDVIKKRWFDRAASRGKRGNAALMQYKDVNETAQIYIRPAMQHADIVLNGLVSCEYIEEVIDNIFKAIQSVLK